ncbi:hypothetical protein MYX07_00690 [Patescibacteria group bacterium AH-259-L07]|nr:hypothetical protein [Patescibacteria group bacterium AH-259-L07]
MELFNEVRNVLEKGEEAIPEAIEEAKKKFAEVEYIRNEYNNPKSVNFRFGGGVPTEGTPEEILKVDDSEFTRVKRELENK